MLVVDVNKMVVCLYWSISVSAINHFPENIKSCKKSWYVPTSAMNYWISQKIIFKFIGNGFGRYAKGVPCSYEFKR